MTQTDEQTRRAQKRAWEIDALKKQCAECKHGLKEIGPRSGCEVRKKLTIDQSDVAWRNKYLFFDGDKCKMFVEIKRGSNGRR